MYDFQKANMWKRISAALCDLIVLGIAVVGLALLLSTLLGYDGYTARLEALSDSYETEYNVDFNISASDYGALTDEQKALYQTAMDAFAADSEASYVYTMIVNFTFLIITFSILIAFLLFEFFVPLLFGNGQTLGKKVFGVAVMREDCVKISPVILFARTVLGKCTVETLLPAYVLVMIYLNLIGIVGTTVIIALLIAQTVLLATTKARTPLHDKLAHTVTVDYASQMIFDSPEALMEYKQRLHAEKVASEKE